MRVNMMSSSHQLPCFALWLMEELTVIKILISHFSEKAEPFLILHSGYFCSQHRKQSSSSGVLHTQKVKQLLKDILQKQSSEA